jgi:5'-nucleotidase
MALVSLVLCLGAGAAAAQNQMRVLVTNDDGIGAPGIDALVQALGANGNLTVTVVAPAANQSGTGDQVTNQPGATITSTASETAGGVPGIAIEGFPADAVLWGIRTALPPLPDLVVSGINTGQNIGEAVRLSGTVGAALWAARLGIPAFAASTQFSISDYGEAARFVARLVEKFRTNKKFRRKMLEKETGRGLVLNLNIPDCPDGGRGMRLVTVGRSVEYTGYTLLADDGTVRTWEPVQAVTNLNAVDCASTDDDVRSDVEAFLAGFATVTPLSDEGQVSSRALKQFGFVPKIY